MPSHTTATDNGRLSIVQMGGMPESVEGLAEAVHRGLTTQPKWLSCQYFYDELGSQLFERICDLPEYYPTRTEDSILRRHADEMVQGWSQPPVMIELGSGSSTKTQRLISAALSTYGRLHYAPIEVSPTILEQSAQSLVDGYPELRVTGYAADYRQALPRACSTLKGPKLVVFLGSSLGNFEADDAAELLSMISSLLGPEDRFLLGTDLAKDRHTLEAAYDDAAGVTAAFNKNVLVRINRELDADFRLEQFDHQVHYSEERYRVETRLASLVDQVVQIPGAGLEVHFHAGETIHTENSHKYTPDRLAELAERTGFQEEAAWTDDLKWYRIQRWRPRG